MATPAQVEANRANALLSTGPSTPEGKLKCSHNALKTGLTGRTIVLPTDDIAAYQKLVAQINSKFQPETDYEKHLVQGVADTEWRLLRIPTLEAGLYSIGRNELAGEFASETDPGTRAAMIEAQIFRVYKRDFGNLRLQENRLRSQLEKDTAQLTQIQDDRDLLLRARRNEAMFAFDRAKSSKQPFNLADFGSEFSAEYLTARYQAFRSNNNLVPPAFERAWKAKVRSQAA